MTSHFTQTFKRKEKLMTEHFQNSEQSKRISLYRQTYKEAYGANKNTQNILDLMSNQTGDKPSPIDQIQQLLETIAQQQVQILSAQSQILKRLSALEH
ncbi:hypothetical protein CFR75_06965 [Komagataeibacter xylinus]|uniref:Uncharacterized protein n=1 Tax=Komagataeibacter xylinus TaxID=28448 RepID=A0A318PIY4_KOMXY|nr:hypothetical protein CFR75_06965 [Komagataeibacter xylinus]